MELRLIDVGKKIEGRTILKGVNLSLKKGEALAIRGVNGSGKTTLLKIIAGIYKDFTGNVEFDRNKYKIGYVPQEILLFEEMSVSDNLKIFAGRKKLGKEVKESISCYVEKLNCLELLFKKVRVLSGGQKRLVNLIACLVGEPDLILLDEVIVGLDEDKVKLVESVLREMKEEKILLVTSHQEGFLNNVCNRSAKIDGGEWKLEG